jgi:outer membrane protein
MPTPFVKLLMAAVCLSLCAMPCRGADEPQLRGLVRAYSFAEAVQTAEANFPSVQGSIAREQAAMSGISLARTAYLPRLDTVVQEVRGSTSPMNSIYVPVLHLPLITASETNSRDFGRSIWAGTTGTVLNWELIDFGLRRAQVRAAQAQHRESQANVVFTRFDVGVAAADAFFAVLAAEQRVRAERANVERFGVFVEAVGALVRSELRAGVDLSRAEAELARAKDLLIRAEQDRDVARALLAERMGIAGAMIDVVTQPFVVLPQTAVEPLLPAFEQHPLALQNAALINTVLAREKVISREWYPHIIGLAAVQARGSGTDRGNALARAGFLPDVPNWMVGLSATFPIMDFFQIRIRQKIEHANERGARARYAEIMQVLKGNDAVARAEIEGAVRRAANAPAFLKAAQDTVTRARIRYKVGLGTVVDVAEAERLLTDAQVISDTAAIAVWRAYLAAAVAHGDIDPFIKLVATAGAR